MKISVGAFRAQFGYWDHSLIGDILPRPIIETDIPYEEGGLLIVAGRTGAEHKAELQSCLDRMPWVVLLIVSDEAGKLDWTTLRLPERSTVWSQYPRGNGKPLPVGYRPETRGLLKNMDLPEKKGWFFAGQAQHGGREACIDVLKSRTDGELHISKGFGKGLDYDTYVTEMTKARVAPCPDGNVHPDTFRIYEALECGTLPVVIKHEFWDGPFPQLDSWDELPELLDRYEDIDLWRKDCSRAVAWWQGRKREIRVGILDDARELA